MDRMVHFIDSQLDSVLRAPGMWGGIMALEPIVLTLLSVRIAALDEHDHEAAIERMRRDYARFLAQHTGPGPQGIAGRLNDDQAIVDVLTSFVDRWRSRAE